MSIAHKKLKPQDYLVLCLSFVPEKKVTVKKLTTRGVYGLDVALKHIFDILIKAWPVSVKLSDYLGLMSLIILL